MWSKWYMNEERRLIEKAVKTFAEKKYGLLSPQWKMKTKVLKNWSWL